MVHTKKGPAPTSNSSITVITRGKSVFFVIIIYLQELQFQKTLKISFNTGIFMFFVQHNFDCDYLGRFTATSLDQTLK